MIDVAIFDLDGLLIDSEPLWQRVEEQVFGELGLELNSSLCQQTTGLRVDEVVRHWHRRRPWEGPTVEEVTERLILGVVDLLREEGRAKPGALEVTLEAREAGLRLALASSSPRRIIDAALDRLGLGHAFEVIHSAEVEDYGKPHPAVYLATAARLGVEPMSCLAFEDSLNGVIAAKAARMRCVAVPEVDAERRAPFAVADAVVHSLLEVDAAFIQALLGR